MNDLDLLQRFRAETPEPDDLWLLQVREGITLGAAPRAEFRRPASRRPRAVILAAATVAVAAVIVAGTWVLPEGSPTGPNPAVADVLRRFSRIAVNAPAEEPPLPGQYVYTKTTQVETRLFSPGPGLDRFSYQVSSQQERWVGLDGSGRSQESWGEPVFLTDEDRRAYEAFVRSPAYVAWGGRDGFDWGTTHSYRFAEGELSNALSPLPNDPKSLMAELVRQEGIGGSNGDWGVFTHAAGELVWRYMSPELRSALFEVMSRIPGTELIGPVRDALGRRGIAIGHTRDGVREEVVFDRRTGDILAMRTVRVQDDPEAGDEVGQNPCCGEFAWAGTDEGTVMFETTYLFDGVVVESMNERPSTDES